MLSYGFILIVGHFRVLYLYICLNKLICEKNKNIPFNQRVYSLLRTLKAIIA
ncbi:hypothetical protein HMPREF1394_00805 [Helicobacter pylori GAM105Ai]|nr:hypothetical protein HMPREF1394_00805 [Helicobacter pylori GAM105Ai]